MSYLVLVINILVTNIDIILLKNIDIILLKNIDILLY